MSAPKEFGGGPRKGLEKGKSKTRGKSGFWSLVAAEIAGNVIGRLIIGLLGLIWKAVVVMVKAITD